ncbi:MAG: murein biosynthesis integral membrane protein MurJ, partial [Actinomycetota bacterium]|nr:murein biosynthesis integral membrane protein MurJ [Actinomycetota bacterium]
MSEPTSAASSRRHASLVAAGILLSRLSGLARQVVVGYYLGTSYALDAYTAAFRIPNLMQNLLGEGVLSASFIPVHSRLLAQGRDAEAGRVAGAVAGLLITVTGLLSLAGVVFAEPLTAVVAAGFTGRRQELAVSLVRILTPGVGLLVLSAWCLGVLNSHRRFFLSYVAPVLWNAAQVAGLAVAGGLLLRGGDEQALLESLAVALAWGTLAGGLLQLGVQLPTVLRLSRGLRVSLDVSHRGVRDTVRAFGPVVAGRGAVQLSAYVDTLLASFLATGALAALSYAQLLYLLPVSLFGMSVAAAELPELSAGGAADGARLRARLDDGLARIAFYVAPTIVAFLVAGDLLVGAVFEYGRFGGRSTTVVWIVLCGYSLGLLAGTANRLLQSALYGVSQPAVAARASALRVVVSAALGAVLMLQLDRVVLGGQGLSVVGELPALTPLSAAERADEVGADHLGALGLTLAAGMTAWLEFALLRRAVAARIGSVRLGGHNLPPTLLAAGA